jgi:tRNA pseudouridine38-40 synthase
MHDGPVPDPFLRRYCYHHKRRLDAAAMARAAKVLHGRHDFHSFETEWPNRASSVRTVTHIAISRVGDLIWLDVEADGFLYNMVRAIAGTLLNVGRGYWPETQVQAILQAEDRTVAGPTAPAQGLFLMRVTYEQ